ncbi:uncharacterized protein BDV14DRAFT_196712 [Aspergillus stella-maris]|uniref:uncharacterized protein n=1 Tax=Aspergillus stella-maris TaxID=1810926 RepID=UPI003CCD0D56
MSGDKGDLFDATLKEELNGVDACIWPPIIQPSFDVVGYALHESLKSFRAAYSSGSLLTFPETGDPDNDRDDIDADTDMNARRENQTAELKAYKERLGSTDVWCGASIVRDYSILCPQYSVMEQYVSICVREPENDDGWKGKPRFGIARSRYSLTYQLSYGPTKVFLSTSLPWAHGLLQSILSSTHHLSWIGPQATRTAPLKQQAPSKPHTPQRSSLQRTLEYQISDTKSKTARANSAASAASTAKSHTITTGLETLRHTMGILRRHSNQFLTGTTLALRNARSNINGDCRFDLASVLRRDADYDSESESDSASQSTHRKESETLDNLISQYFDLEGSCKDLKNTCCSAINFAATTRINADQRECNQKMRRICKQHKRFLIVVTAIIGMRFILWFMDFDWDFGILQRNSTLAGLIGTCIWWVVGIWFVFRA